MPDVPIRCACGALRGTVRDLDPEAGLHVTCYCASCQAYAHWLGRADEMLDPQGATAIFQTSPARVGFEAGELACMRLTPGGLLRWHSACCRSGIANTMGPGLPFAGLIRGALAAEDAALGPVAARVWASHAHGPVPYADASQRLAFGQLLRLFARMAGSRLRGEQARSPFFRDGTPVAERRVLPADEYAALMEKARRPAAS